MMGEYMYVPDLKIPYPGSCRHWKMFVGLVLPNGGSQKEFVAKFLSSRKSAIYRKEYRCHSNRLEKGALRRPCCPFGVECKPCLCLHCSEIVCAGSKEFVQDHFRRTGHSMGYCRSTVFCFRCMEFVFEALIPGVSGLSSGEKFQLVGKQLRNSPTFFLRGIINMGNTCFMNCVIQVLVHTPQMSNLITEENDRVRKRRRPCPASRRVKKESQPEAVAGILPVFKELLREFQIRVEKPVAPTKLLAAIYENIPHLAGHRQQDAHEFFISILNSLHVELINYSFPEKAKTEVHHELDSIIDQIYLGRLQSEVTCTVCSLSRFTIDPFRGAALEIVEGIPDKSIDVNNLLSQFTRLEHLDEGTKLFCPCCNKRTMSTRQLSFKVLPKVVCLQLKRFQHNPYPNSNCLKKLKTPVKILDIVNFAPFLSACTDETNVLCNNPEKDSTYESLKGLPIIMKYKLYAIITHTGTFVAGHYHTYVKLKSFWFCCNDDTVRMVSREEALNTEGYLLFYKQSNSLFD